MTKNKKGAASCALGVSGWKKRLFTAALKAQAENSKAAEEEQTCCRFRNNGNGEVVYAVGSTRRHGPAVSRGSGGVNQSEVNSRSVVKGCYRTQIDSEGIPRITGGTVPRRVWSSICEDCQFGTKLGERRTICAVLQSLLARASIAAGLVPSQLYTAKTDGA